MVGTNWHLKIIKLLKKYNKYLYSNGLLSIRNWHNWNTFEPRIREKTKITIKKNTFPGVVVLGFAGIEGVAWMSNTIPPMITGSASPFIGCPPFSKILQPKRKSQYRAIYSILLGKEGTEKCERSHLTGERTGLGRVSRSWREIASIRLWTLLSIFASPRPAIGDWSSESSDA